MGYFTVDGHGNITGAFARPQGTYTPEQVIPEVLDEAGNVVTERQVIESRFIPDPGFMEIADDDPRVLAFLAPKQDDYVAAVQYLLDSTAQQRNYDSVASGASYAGDPDPVFNAEGTALKAWRSKVWRDCYTALAAVQAGTAQPPTVDDFIKSLPAMIWPA